MKRVLHLLISFVLLTACAGASPPSRKAPINIILITLDTLRADHVSCYGAEQVETPTLDSLCRDGVVFERAFSQVPLTWPSHVAILTGTYPFQNGVQDFTGQPLSSGLRTVTQEFKEHGYATGAVVSSFVLDRSWGLARGFDSYDDAFSAQDFPTKDLGLVERRAEESVTHAIAWLDKARRHPFFLWLHLYDPHSPYDSPEPYRSQYRDHPYDGEIAYADQELGRLITWLKANHLYDRSLIVFLSDHGESLGEHGEQEHGFFIYNSTAHVPLIVKPPVGSHLGPRRVNRPVETIAVAPTLLGLAGLKDPMDKQFHVSSLFEASSREEGAYSETFYPFSSFGWSPLHALETSRYHYIDAPEPELYDVIADPEERNNLASQQTALVAVMRDELQQRLRIRPFDSKRVGVSNLSPDAAEKLRALGYVAYQSAVSAAALASGLADPKSKVREFNSILQAQDAFRAGNFAAGETLLKQVQEKDPQMYAVPFMLGEAALRQQKWSDAEVKMKAALTLNPNFDQAMTGLAHALHGQGNDVEARKWLQEALRLNRQNYRAWYELGSIDARSDKASTLAAYEKAVSIQPNFAQGQRDLGVLEVEEKRYRQGSEHLLRALALGLDDARLRNFLGIAYSQTGRLQKAIDSYRQALRVDPNLAQAHLNLAYAYQRLNRAKDANREYEAACQLHEKFCQFVPKAR